jgi:folate-binding protein YgfZ
MTMTELTENLRGLRHEEYRGSQTVSAYSDTGREFRALVDEAGIYDLTWRTKLLVTGKDRIRWLNGMITNNVRDLAVGQGVYNFLLTSQGRILADLYTYNRGDFLLVDTDQCQVEVLLSILRRYIIMDQVEIQKADDQLRAVCLAGPNSRALLSRILGHVPELKPLEIVSATWKNGELTLVGGDWPGAAAYQIWLAEANRTPLWQELVNAGAVEVGSEAVEHFRIACGIPHYGQDIRERDLPQETEQMRALSFTKGCYIGQEIVERIRSRGAVHRKFTGFQLAGPLPPIGSKAQSEGREIAEITSTATLPSDGGHLNVALGYMRRQLALPGNTIEIAGATATVSDLPFREVFAAKHAQ